MNSSLCIAALGMQEYFTSTTSLSSYSFIEFLISGFDIYVHPYGVCYCRQILVFLLSLYIYTCKHTQQTYFIAPDLEPLVGYSTFR